jgi:precorrin-6A/cobalt-precorrin-6A reductase
VAGDLALMRDHAIDVVVCKNSGGSGAEAKLAAARALDLPVILIDRPDLPPCDTCATAEAVVEWVAQTRAT